MKATLLATQVRKQCCVDRDNTLNLSSVVCC